MDFDKPKVYGDTFISDGLVRYSASKMDGNEGFELIAVDHLKGEKSGKEMDINNRRKRENSPAGDELQQSSVIV